MLSRSITSCFTCLAYTPRSPRGRGGGELFQREELREVAAHEDHVGGVHGEPCAGADGDAHGGRREGHGVVEAVAHEDHPAASGLELGAERGLVRRKALRPHLEVKLQKNALKLSLKKRA